MRLEVNPRVEDRSNPPFKLTEKKDCKCGNTIKVKTSNREHSKLNYCPVCGREV